MNIMKYWNQRSGLRSLRIVLALTVFALVQACDVTDLQPATALSETTAFETAERAELAAIGMYNSAQSGFYLGGQVRGYPFGAASIEQAEMRGEDMVNQALFYQITYEAGYTPFSANNVFMWNTLYGVVNQANVVIEGCRAAAQRGSLSVAKAEEYEGEARFLRALSHHELLIHFAQPYNHSAGATHLGVPYRDFAVNSGAKIDQAVAQGRNSVAECYTKLIEDLNYAEEKLPVTRSGPGRISRATKGAAIALKTRVLQHKGDWAGVIAEGSKLVPASAPFTSPIGAYALTATPDGPFANNLSSEAIFSIENNDVDNSGVNGALPAMLGNTAKGGRGLVLISPIFYNNSYWKGTDKRRAMLSDNGRSFFTDKYRDITARTDDTPIMRYAEVLLNMAEAIVRNSGDKDRALALLNAVRDRSVDAADVYTLASFATDKDFIAAILWERRIELLAEGRRWPDIHRLVNDPDFSTGGIPAKVAFGDVQFVTYNFTTPPTVPTRIAAIDKADRRFLWPIPADELAQNPTLAQQQNPGY